MKANLTRVLNDALEHAIYEENAGHIKDFAWILQSSSPRVTGACWAQHEGDYSIHEFTQLDDGSWHFFGSTYGFEDEAESITAFTALREARLPMFHALAHLRRSEVA